MSMKIIIVVLLCCLLLVGCGTSDIGLGRAGASTENEFLIRSVGERWDELLDGDNFIAEWIEDLPRGIPLKENRITLQRALEIANNIFVLNLSNEWLSRSVFYIYSLEDRGLYIVSRWSNEPELGWVRSVAICKYSGNATDIFGH